MTEEARTFVGDLVWNDRNFMELFTANYGYPNAELAAHLRRAGAAERVRSGAVSGGIGARRYSGSGAVPGPHRQARRFLSDRARACSSASSFSASTSPIRRPA